MKWQKKGLIYAPAGDLWWARQYAHLPTAFQISSDAIRIFFASLDENKFGRIGFIDVSADDPSHILDHSPEPVLDLGPLGLFDDSGVNPSCMLRVDDALYLYYIGWQRTQRVPYMLYAGLAISRDNGTTFSRYAPTPILDRTPDEPFLRSATTILQEDSRYRAWYVSGTGWTTVRGASYPTYVIRYADSADGVHWSARTEPCIGPHTGDEFGFGRPWVVHDADRYRMWYSIRSRTAPYCIGYAESLDGYMWERKDDLIGIAASAEGWDSEMICYPCVIDVGSARYMFYNGNQHGLTGFGYAILEHN